VFFRYAGMLLTDSPDATQNPRCGFGMGSDVDLDTVTNGIIVTASTSAGYQITNLTVATPGGGAAVQLKSGGSLPPDVLINGGSVVGSWSLGAFPTAASGNLTAVNIIGFNLP
jgi:hypothetical protein